MKDNDLVGTWRLVSSEAVAADGRVSYPLGHNAIGYITYTEDGYMSVSMMSANRPNHAAADPLGGTDAEKIAAAETYLSYCGRYEVQGDRVFHHIDVAFLPNRTGTTQERVIERSGEVVSLTTPPMLIKGEEVTGRVLWKRAVNPDSTPKGDGNV